MGASKRILEKQFRRLVTCRNCDNCKPHKDNKTGMCLDIDDLKFRISLDTKRICKFFIQKEDDF